MNLKKYSLYLIFLLIIVLFPINNFYNFDSLNFDSDYVGNFTYFIFSFFYFGMILFLWFKKKQEELLSYFLLSGLALGIYSFFINSWNGFNFFPFIIMILFMIRLIMNNKNNHLILGQFIFLVMNLFFILFMIFSYFNKNRLLMESGLGFLIYLVPFIIYLLLIYPTLSQLYKKQALNKIMIPITIFYFYLLLSLLYAVFFRFYSFSHQMTWVLIIVVDIMYLIFFLMYRVSSFDVKKFYHYVSLFFVGLSLIILIKMAFYAIGIYHEVSPILTYKRLYSYPTMSTSNYTIAIVNILFLLIFTRTNVFSRKVLALIWGIEIVNTVISQSRGGVVALGSVLGLYLLNYLYHLIKSNKRVFYKLMKRMAIVLGGLIVLVLLFYHSVLNALNELPIIDRFERNLFHEANILDRFSYITDYYHAFINSPIMNQIFGNGLSYQINLETRPHNIYILLLHQSGYIGLVLFLIVMAYYLIHFRKTPLIYVFIYLLIHSLFEPLLLTFWIDSLLFLFIFVESIVLRKDHINEV